MTEQVTSRCVTLSRLAAVICCIVWLSQGFAAEQSSSNQAVAVTAVPAYRQANQVALLRVEGVIDSVTLMSLERRMKQAVNDGADAVVLDIDTPGGELGAALDICNLVKDRTETPANVVAWVNPNAYSAGTIIALACREIIVAPNSTFGDAAPIDILGRQLAPTERAKALSPLQAEVIDSARLNHYDENLVKSFLMIGVELWLIENIQTGERIVVGREEYRTAFGEDPPPHPVATTPVDTPADTSVVPWVDQSIPKAQGSSADSEITEELKLYEQNLPPVRIPLTESDRGQWNLVRQVTDGTTLLTVKPDEALFYGLATAIVANETELTAFFGAQTIRHYDESWSEGLVRVLVSLPVRAVLIVIFLIALFVELAAPGVGVFGATATVALLVLIGAPALVGMAQWWDILLIVLGILLVIVELFVLPGMGIVGVLGILSLLIGVVGTFVSGDVRTLQGQNELWTGLLTTLASVFAAGVGIWLLSRQLHSLPIFDRLILRTELGNPDANSPGSSTSQTGVGLLEAMGSPQQAIQEGDQGVAETDLRPAGRVNFNGRMVDVKSISSFIEKGSPVRVVSVGRFVIEVEEV